MKLTLRLSLSVNENPVWSKATEVSEKLNHAFTPEEMEEAIMVAEDHLVGLTKKKTKKEKVGSPGGTD